MGAGLSVALASSSLALDTAEDVVDVATITATFLRFAPERARVVGALVGQKFERRVVEAARRAVKRIGETRVARRFVEGLTAQRLASTGLQLDAEVSLSWTFAGDSERVLVSDSRSNPSLRDTDGDGVDDFEERRESYSVRFTASADATRAFYGSLKDESEDPTTFTSRETGLDSNPFVADSDGDGVDDRAERAAGTNAEQADTDGDGIADREELSETKLDPTLYDARPPAISIEEAEFGKPAFSLTTTYLLSFVVDDAAGVDTVRIVKDGTARFEDHPHARSITYFNFVFKTGAGETLLDGQLGATVQVEAVDANDNERTVVALERTNFYGTLAKKLGSDTIFGRQVAGRLGLLSGFTVGFGETVNSFVQLLQDVPKIAAVLEQLQTLLRKAHLIDDIIERIPAAIDQRQQVSNPFDPEENRRLFRVFEAGWYSGYAAYFVVEALAGVAATKLLKNSARFQRFVSGIDKAGVLTKGYRAYVKAGQVATAPVRRVGLAVRKGISRGADIGSAAARRTLAGRVRRTNSSTSGSTSPAWSRRTPLTAGFISLP